MMLIVAPDSEIDDTRRFTHNVDGWLSVGEGALLYNLARNVSSAGAIVEIGSWKGKSTIWLGRGSQNGNRAKVYAVDPHTGSPEINKVLGEVWTLDEFKRNIAEARLQSIVDPLVMTSEEAARDFRKAAELVFIDGAHEYDSVRLDFELWFPKVVEGGIMAFHDTNGRPGSTTAVTDLVYKSRYFRNVRYIDSITYAEKVRKNSVLDRIRNRAVLLLKNLPLPNFGIAGKLNFIPVPIRTIGKWAVKKLESVIFESQSSW